MTELPPFTLHELIARRAIDPSTAGRPMAKMDGTVVSYRAFAERSLAWAKLLLRARRDPRRGPRAAVLMRNNLEFLDCYGGVAFAGGTLFGLNTGLSGEVLASVIEQSEAELVVVDAEHAPVIDAIKARLPRVTHVFVVGSDRLGQELSDLSAEIGGAIEPPACAAPATAESPLCVIYTSGTTGLPKGVVNSHGKLRGVGLVTSGMLRLASDDVGYISMPLFHSNALFLNWIPALTVGASVALRDRFSASGFVKDVLRYRATYWNYVGQPVHYVLEAIKKTYGGDEARILLEVRDHPDNRLRLAVGTGASGRERRRFMDWLGLDHVYEMYGSTEAEISAWCLPHDPLDSVGELRDEEVFIAAEDGSECPPLELDRHERALNADRAVGEIVRRGTVGLFQGYHGLPEASASKVRDGLYRSGDLGAIRILRGRRYLYFFGRSDDWIRKDGENFGAESVAGLVKSSAAVEQAVAYGVPHPVSDEWVMAAIELRAGATFDPESFLHELEAEIERGGDRKWIPDFVRVVDEFEWTETLKIKVRGLKRDHYHPERAPAVWWRQRGDTSYRRFLRADFAALTDEFRANGRGALLS